MSEVVLVRGRMLDMELWAREFMLVQSIDIRSTSTLLDSAYPAGMKVFISALLLYSFLFLFIFVFGCIPG